MKRILGLSLVLCAASFVPACRASAGGIGQEIVNPKRDLKISSLKLALGPHNKPVFDKAAAGWRAEVEVVSNSAFDEYVPPPIMTVDGVAAKPPADAAARTVRSGEKTTWVYIIPSGKGASRNVSVALQGMPANKSGATLSISLKVPPTADLQVTLENFSVEPAGDKFALRADVDLLNNGGAAAKRYKLKYSITTAQNPAETGREFTTAPLAANGSSLQASQTLFPALDRDPIKAMDTVTATVTLLDDDGQPVTDGDPGNDSFSVTPGGPVSLQSAADLQVALKNTKLVRAADNTLILKADVAIKNAGAIRARRYKLKYSLTVAEEQRAESAPSSDASSPGEPGAIPNLPPKKDQETGKTKTSESEVTDAPIKGNGAVDQTDRPLFTGLTTDPMATGETVTATIVLLDEKGLPVKDADPGNDTFTLKLVGDPAPPPHRDIFIKDVSIGEAGSGSVPVTVRVVNNGPRMEPKITVRLVPTGGYPASLLESREITNLGENGTEDSVDMRVPLLETPGTVKFRARLSVAPADPVLTRLESEEKTLELPSPWSVGVTEVPDLSEYDSTPYSEKDMLSKAAALAKALGSEGKYKVKVGATYNGPVPMKGSYKLALSGFGDPRTGEPLDNSADPKSWDRTFEFDLPKTDDQTVLFRVAVLDANGKTAGVGEKAAKVPGLKSEYMRKLFVEKHDLKISGFGPGEGSVEVGDPSDGKMTVHAKIKAAGTVKENRASILFEVDGKELRTLGLPPIEANTESDFTFHLPWRDAKKLKATVSVGESSDIDSQDVAPADNTAEMAMPTRDLAIAEIAPLLGSDKKPVFNQIEKKWPVIVTVKNAGDFEEEVVPPSVLVGDKVFRHTDTNPRSIPKGKSATWTVFAEPDAKDRAMVVAALRAKDADVNNNLKAMVLQFPPKPPRLDLSVQSATARPEKSDYSALTIPIDVVVKNTGEGESVPLNLYVTSSDNNSVKPKEVPKLQKGAETTLTFNFPLKEASQSVKAWLNTRDDSTDSDRSNNEKAVTVPRLPWDLNFGDVTLGTVDKNKRTVPVVIKVNNAGKAPVKGKQIGVKLGESEYVSDASAAPEIGPGKSTSYTVNVPLAATGGPAKVTVQVMGSLEGELTPADDKKEVDLTLPDKPLWNLAVTKVVVADKAFRNHSFPGFAVAVTVTNQGARTEDAPTVSLTRRNGQILNWMGPNLPLGEPDMEVADRKTVSKKLEPNASDTVLFFVPDTYKGRVGIFDLTAALVDNKDDNSQDDQAVEQTWFEARDLSISALEFGENMTMIDKGVVSIPARVHLNEDLGGRAFDDTIFDVTLKPGSASEVTKKITDGSAMVDLSFNAKWGDTVPVTFKVVADRDANPDNNTKTRTIKIPNPPVKIDEVRVNPDKKCFYVFTTFDPAINYRGYKVSIEGSGVAKTEADLQVSGGGGWSTYASICPAAFTTTGPWNFTVKLLRDGKVVLEQAVTAPTNPYNPATMMAPTAANRAAIAARNFKVASITGPTDAELAAIFAKKQRKSVPVKVTLARVEGDTNPGKITVRVKENGTAVAPDIAIAIGDNGQGSGTVDLPLNKTKSTRNLTAMMVDFEDNNFSDDTLTAGLSNIPAQPLFDVGVMALEVGEFQDGKALMKVTVTNRGDRTEKAIPVRLALDDATKGGDDKKIESLDPKQSVVLEYQVAKPADTKSHKVIAEMLNFNDDNRDNNYYWGKTKFGYDYKVGNPVLQTEEITGPSARFTVKIDRVSGNYPSDEMMLKTEFTRDFTPAGFSAKRTATGSFEGTFEVPLFKEHNWTGGVGAVMVDEDDNPKDNSGAVNITLPWAPRSELYVAPLVMTQYGIVYDVKFTVKSQSDYTEKNVKVGLRMDGRQIQPDAMIAAVPKGGSVSGNFRVPAHTAGTYRIEGMIIDRKDLYPDNNIATVMLTLTAAKIPPQPAPPKKVIAATLTPASPVPGGDFTMSCKGLPEPDETKQESYTSELIQKDPSPYQFGFPKYSIKKAGATKTITTYELPTKFELPKMGSMDELDLAVGIIGGAIKGGENGGNVGDVLLGGLKGLGSTLVGDMPMIVGSNDKFGMDEEKKPEDFFKNDTKTEVEIGPDELTFNLDKETPPGSYVMRFRIKGNDDVACEAPFTIR